MEWFRIKQITKASAQLLPDTTLTSFTKSFNGAIESGNLMGSCNFGIVLPIDLLKRHRGKIHVF